MNLTSKEIQGKRLNSLFAKTLYALKPLSATRKLSCTMAAALGHIHLKRSRKLRSMYAVVGGGS